MSVVRIRRMERGDIPAVAALGRQAFSEPWSERAFDYSLDIEENVFLVAEHPGGFLVGYCGLYCLADEGEVINLMVDEPYRRRGIAAALLERAMEISWRQGVRQIFLEARASNEAAISLYRNYGFMPIGTRRNFYRFPVEDALCMRLTLDETGRIKTD